MRILGHLVLDKVLDEVLDRMDEIFFLIGLELASGDGF